MFLHFIYLFTLIALSEGPPDKPSRLLCVGVRQAGHSVDLILGAACMLAIEKGKTLTAILLAGRIAVTVLHFSILFNMFLIDFKGFLLLVLH